MVLVQTKVNGMNGFGTPHLKSYQHRFIK